MITNSRVTLPSLFKHEFYDGNKLSIISYRYKATRIRDDFAKKT